MFQMKPKIYYSIKIELFFRPLLNTTQHIGIFQSLICQIVNFVFDILLQMTSLPTNINSVVINSNPPDLQVPVTTQLSELALEKPIKAGWMKIKVNVNWKKRWIVLRGTTLSIYKDSSEYTSWIVLDLNDIMSINKLNTRKRTILVVVSNKKTYFLDIFDAAERESWENELKRVAPKEVKINSDYYTTTSSDFSSGHSENDEDDQVYEQKTLYNGPISQKKGLIVKKYHGVIRPKALYYYKDTTEYQPVKVIYWRNVLDAHITEDKRDEITLVTSKKRYKFNVEEKDAIIWLKYCLEAQKSVKNQEGLWEDKP